MEIRKQTSTRKKNPRATAATCSTCVMLFCTKIQLQATYCVGYLGQLQSRGDSRSSKHPLSSQSSCARHSKDGRLEAERLPSSTSVNYAFRGAPGYTVSIGVCPEALSLSGRRVVSTMTPVIVVYYRIRRGVERILNADPTKFAFVR